MKDTKLAGLEVSNSIPAGYGRGDTELTIRWAIVLSTAGATEILTHHEVTNKSGKLLVGYGKPVDVAVARRLLETISQQKAAPSSGWISNQLIFRTANSIAWVSPAKVAPMYFRAGKRRIVMSVPWPELVFVARGRESLFVFATTGESRPGPKTKLYHAPFANIFQDGTLCWGNISHPDFGEQSIPAYEAAVYRTYFTTPNHQGVLSKAHGKRGLMTFYNKLKDRGAQEFPVEALNPFGRTLEEFCEA